MALACYLFSKIPYSVHLQFDAFLFLITFYFWGKTLEYWVSNSIHRHCRINDRLTMFPFLITIRYNTAMCLNIIGKTIGIRHFQVKKKAFRLFCQDAIIVASLFVDKPMYGVSSNKG